MGPSGGSEHRDEPGPFGVPPEVIEQAKAAFSVPKERLAGLVFDSLVDSDAGPEDHRLRFEHDGMSVDLDVSALPEGTELSGRVQPAAERVALHIRGTDLAMVSDVHHGRFSFRPVPHGLVRLSVEGMEPPVWTDWFRV